MEGGVTDNLTALPGDPPVGGRGILHSFWPTEVLKMEGGVTSALSGQPRSSRLLSLFLYPANITLLLRTF